MQLPSRYETELPKLIDAIVALAKGRGNFVGTVTLATGKTTTVVENENIVPTSRIQLQEASASAAAERAAGTCYVSAVANKSFTITHSNSADATRAFHWAAQGG